VNTMAMILPRRLRRWHVWLPMSALLAVAIGAPVWLLGFRSAPEFSEYPMLVRTDIPAAVAVAPDGAVWFTIEFSDAIGVFRNGQIHRIRTGNRNLEPLGLAADGTDGAWYTDTTLRAISRISSAGDIRSFPLSTPIIRLGRLAAAYDGAVWFADMASASVTQLRNGVFTPHGLGSDGATPYGIAIDMNGVVWTTLQGVDKLGRISTDGQVTTFEVPAGNRGLGDVAVDRSGAVWFLELGANKIGRFAEGRFTDFAIPTPSAGLTALAAAPDGSVWFTELSAGKLGQIRNGRVNEFRLPRANSRPFGVAVDAMNNVWYTDLSGWLGVLRTTHPAGE
jgi:virginiamycin B lyase